MPYFSSQLPRSLLKPLFSLLLKLLQMQTSVFRLQRLIWLFPWQRKRFLTGWILLFRLLPRLFF